MTNAAAQNLAQHIAAAFIRRQHAIIDEESCRARMVGDDAQAGIAKQRLKIRRRSALRRLADLLTCRLAVLPTRQPDQFCRPPDQRCKQIRLEVRNFALHDGGHALQAHARVDGGLG